MDPLYARDVWPSLSAQRLALMGIGLVGLACFHMWAAGHAVTWIAQSPAQRTWGLEAIGLINALVTATLLACLLVAALRCDQSNDLRFLGLLSGSMFGLLLLLGSPEQRFDRLGYETLRALQQTTGVSAQSKQYALEAVKNRDLVALHQIAHRKARSEP